MGNLVVIRNTVANIFMLNKWNYSSSSKKRKIKTQHYFKTASTYHGHLAVFTKALPILEQRTMS
jgi:hypothetical protein